MAFHREGSELSFPTNQMLLKRIVFSRSLFIWVNTLRQNVMDCEGSANAQNHREEVVSINHFIHRDLVSFEIFVIEIKTFSNLYFLLVRKTAHK